MAKTKPKAEPEEPEATEKLALDTLSFTGPERLECQERFDASYGDLLSCIFEAVDVRREGPTTIQIVDRDGNRHFPDQIIQFMVWVQSKRDDPEVELSSFDDMRLSELAGAYVRGRLGKARQGGKPKPTKS